MPCLMLVLQVVPLAKPGRDGSCSYPGFLRIICGDNGHFPAGFRIGVYLDIMPFFGEAIPNHFRQFSGGYLCFLHDSVPLFTEHCRAGERFWRTPLSSAPGVPIRRSKFMPCNSMAAVARR